MMDVGPNLLDALVRIQIEYVEMPQLKLTARQVERLWNLPAAVCEAALSALLHKGFLAKASDGAYVRCSARRAEIDRYAALTRAS
jgi:hypothetical protein